MPLKFPGDITETIIGTSIRAIGDDGRPVVVIASTEAIQDYGLPRVTQVASDKYDNEQFESNGSIRVGTNDFT